MEGNEKTPLFIHTNTHARTHNTLMYLPYTHKQKPEKRKGQKFDAKRHKKQQLANPERASQHLPTRITTHHQKTKKEKKNIGGQRREGVREGCRKYIKKHT